MTDFRRGARAFAPLAALVAVAGCGGGGHTARPVSATSPAAVESAATDTAAAAALHRAESVLAGVRSYRFEATQTVSGARSATTSEIGSVVRSQGVAYTLTVGRVRTQTVRLRAATYVRKVPGAWARLRRPRPVADPTRTLVALLRAITAASTTAPDTITAALPTRAAAQVGIPVGNAPARLTVTLDRFGHVIRLLVRTATPIHGRDVAVTLVTSYTAFDRVPPLRAP